VLKEKYKKWEIFKYHLRTGDFFNSEAILGRKWEDNSPQSLCWLLEHTDACVAQCWWPGGTCPSAFTDPAQSSFQESWLK